jgi:hypothetical protein
MLFLLFAYRSTVMRWSLRHARRDTATLLSTRRDAGDIAPGETTP